MQFDIFFSICQNSVAGEKPTEKVMFDNFFSQVKLADQLGFETAWVAESHFSSEVQKGHKQPVIPSFSGEVGLNTDFLHLAHLIFQKTSRIGVGSAIRSLFCQGGPLQLAESLRYFLLLQKYSEYADRTLSVGFASGRFAYSYEPYGIKPRNSIEERLWPVLKGKLFSQATEIFLKALRGETFSSVDIDPLVIKIDELNDSKVVESLKAELCSETYVPDSYWDFQALKVLPNDVSLKQLELLVGSHDPKVQLKANSILPVKVMNLSITPEKELEALHERMSHAYHPSGGEWKRKYAPRTVLIFINGEEGLSEEQQDQKAYQEAQSSLQTYWKAMERTLSGSHLEKAVENALWGSPNRIRKQLVERFHPEDRLLCWFDFNRHNTDQVEKEMEWFAKYVMNQ